MNRRRQHPAAAAARRARFYRASGGGEGATASEARPTSHLSPWSSSEGDGASSRRGSLSEGVDGGDLPAAEEAA